MFKKLLGWLKKDNGIYAVEGIPMEDIVDSVKRAIAQKQIDMRESQIRIKKIDLSLKTMATVDTGAEVNLQVPIWGKIELGSKISEKSLQNTSLTLKIPEFDYMDKGFNLEEMDKTIVGSISSIIGGVKAASNADNSPLLEMENATAEFNFILSGDSKISMVIESGFKSELTNNLKITFQKVNSV
ncbi:MAG: hypothetical protein A4E27_00915 [Methanobacterium sp. PtaU1.Bin242]|nr:MAG: hypothetical protein A4E27_00915 [Methanobacterium sp. PtaU1.Bin242]